MRRNLALLAILISAEFVSATSASRPATPDDKKDQLCSIAGNVVRLGTSDPIKKARVHLEKDGENNTNWPSAVTDAAGHFALNGIAPGRYRLFVERTGFVPQQYGETSSHESGAILALNPGQKITDLLFRLVRTAVITGRVQDDDGDPMPEVSVTVFRPIMGSLQSARGPGVEASTNDLGEFRLFGIVPGRYLLSVMPQENGIFMLGLGLKAPSAPEHSGYLPTYYPGTTDISRATPIDVKPGDEINGIDFTLSLTRTYSIKGRVFNAVTGRPGEGMALWVVPVDAENFSLAGTREAYVEGAKGEFEIKSVPSGSYLLGTMWEQDGKAYTSEQRVEVGGADVEGVSVVIAPGVEISGRVAREGAAANQLSDFSVFLEPDNSKTFAWAESPVKPDGSFTLSNVMPGSFRIHVRSSCNDCYLKSARGGGADLLESGLNITQGGAPSSMELVYSSNSASLDGVVTKEDDLPAVGARVVLVPDSPQRKRLGLYKAVSTDQYGRFTLSGVIPGSYKVFAWESVEESEYQDPGFIKPVEDKGQPVSFEENSHKSVQLELIPTVGGEKKH